jgi:hypothetical protein
MLYTYYLMVASVHTYKKRAPPVRDIIAKQIGFSTERQFDKAKKSLSRCSRSYKEGVGKKER